MNTFKIATTTKIDIKQSYNQQEIELCWNVQFANNISISSLVCYSELCVRHSCPTPECTSWAAHRDSRCYTGLLMHTFLILHDCL